MTRLQATRVSPVLLTIPEAAARLSLGRSTVYELLGRKEIRVVRVGRAVRVLARDVDAYAELLAARSA